MQSPGYIGHRPLPEGFFVMPLILSLVGVFVAGICLLDVSCYLWLRHNEAERAVGARLSRRRLILPIN